jgi:hypothetical protein
MKIYIPTRGRIDKQTTLENLPSALREQAVLVVDAAEKDAHFERYGENNVLVAPETCDSIGKVRQAIIDYHDPKKDGDKLIMLDDDLGFNMRRTDIRSKFLPATDESVIEGFALVSTLLDEHCHGGIRARQMSQDAPDIEFNCRTLRALAYNAAVLKKHNIKFDRLIVMEDFDVTLQLLRLGLSNFNISTIIQGQSTSNAPGGCSLYRDHERQAQGAHGLAALHPDFVKVRTKKTNWTGWGSDERTDVTISWKRAYESGAAQH